MPNDSEFVFDENVEEDKSEEIHTNNSSSIEGSKDESSKAWKVLTVDGEIEAVSRKPGRKRSQIWRHFIKTCNGKSAKCNHCTQVLSFAGLSNLLRHLRKKHPSIASGIHLASMSSSLILDSPSNMDGLIFKFDGSGGDRISPDQLRMIKTEQDPSPCSKKLKATDIEYLIKQDHPYVEQPQSSVQPDSLFTQFIQSEINKFQTEYLKRKCKREILQALMKYQQAEDELYSVENNEVITESC